MSKSGLFSLGNKIFICGGLYGQLKIPMTFIYEPITKRICRSQDLGKAAIFSTPGVYFKEKNRIILIDDENESDKKFGIHLFDTTKKRWKFNG